MSTTPLFPPSPQNPQAKQRILTDQSLLLVWGSVEHREVDAAVCYQGHLLLTANRKQTRDEGLIHRWKCLDDFGNTDFINDGSHWDKHHSTSRGGCNESDLLTRAHFQQTPHRHLDLQPNPSNPANPANPARSQALLSLEVPEVLRDSVLRAVPQPLEEAWGLVCLKLEKPKSFSWQPFSEISNDSPLSSLVSLTSIQPASPHTLYRDTCSAVEGGSLRKSGCSMKLFQSRWTTGFSKFLAPLYSLNSG